MKQILVDTLLNLPEKHAFTCPLINSLIFYGKNSSHCFEIDISQNPEKLEIYSYDLFEATEDLERWASSAIKLYEHIPESSKEDKDFSDIDLLILNMKELLNYSLDYLFQCEKSINKTISDWDILHKEYTSLSNNDYIECNRKVDIENLFNTDIKDLFEYEAKEYSLDLENLRNRNNSLREYTYDLIRTLTNNFKEEFNIEQPDDYLNRQFGIKDILSGIKTVNIGLIYNNTEFRNGEFETSIDNEYGKKYFMKLSKDLKSRGFLTSSDVLEFDDMIDPFILNATYLEKYGFAKSESIKTEFQKNLLLDKLKKNGYKIVRFYESIDDFKNDKNSFKTLNLDNLNNEVKNTIKFKIS